MRYDIFLMHWVDPYAWFLLSFGSLMLGLIGASPLNYDHNKDRHIKVHEVIFVYLRRIFLAWIPVMGLIFPMAAWCLYIYYNSNGLTTSEILFSFLAWYKTKLIYWLYPILWLIVGRIIRIYYIRYGKPKVSELLRKFRITQTTDRLSDIRDEKERFAQKNFTPEQYYETGKMFFGINENEMPIYVPRNEWCETNTKIIGPTRKGKGVELGCLIDQSIMHGDTVFYIDDKGDKYIPHIMADRAHKEGRNFLYYDLNDPDSEGDINPGDWAPFVGGNLRARRARILLAAGLGDTGNESDFYKQRERAILDEILEKSEGRLPLLLEEIEKSEKYKEEAKRLYSFLLEWSKIKSLCPKKNRGLSIEKSILNNAIVYIKGSLDDKIICEAVRVLIIEIVQETRRLRDKRASHLALFIDEARFAISKSLADALATILDCKANITLAYQVKSDVRNLEDRTLDGKSIEHSVNTNCQITLIYGSADPETNKWIEEMSGYKIKRVVQIERTKIGSMGEETWGDTRAIGQEKEALITQNTMLILDSRIAVLFRPAKLAEVVFTAFVPTEQENKFDRTDVVKFSSNDRVIETVKLMES